MNTKKKLLSISNLKKYFPIAKQSIFQKEQFFVKANEDISLDIYEGETIGLVGESGCGKSTFGRVLLQLYNQTAGQTIYYGRQISELSPKYVKDTIVHLNKYDKEYKKHLADSMKYSQMVEEMGGEEKADFFTLQNRNISTASSKTALLNITKIVGGLYAIKDHQKKQEGLNLLLNIYNESVKIAKLNLKIDNTKAKIQLLEDSDKNSEKKLEKEKQKLDSYTKLVETYKKNTLDHREAFATFKEQFSQDEKFQKYEAMVDNGIDLARLRYSEMRLLRKDLQIIFQDPYSSLNPRMTVGQIIEEGLVTHNYYKHGSKEMKQYILDVMDECGLQGYMMHRYPHQFSGGQRQRICIARALAVKPRFVVCDECVSALDVSIQSQIINLLNELKEKDNLTYLFISHDLAVVKYISDKIGVMYLGNLVEFADSETIFKDPRHPYTIALLSSIPTTDIDSLDKERIILEGNIPSPIRPPQGCKFHTRCYMACEKCKRVPPELKEVEPGHFVACHFLEKKLSEDGSYLFELPKMEKKTMRASDLEKEEAKEENNE